MENIDFYYFQHSQTFNLTFLTISGQWTRIWKALFLYLSDPDSQIHMECLATLRICSRYFTFKLSIVLFY